MNKMTKMTLCLGLSATMILTSSVARAVDVAFESAERTQTDAKSYVHLSRNAGEIAWSDEPYSWMTADGRVLNRGVTDSDGRATVSRQEGVRDYVLDTVGLRWNYSVDDACWARKVADFGQCVTSVNVFNKAAQEREDEERAKRSARESRHALALQNYRQRAAANDDELSWLGPLPAEWSDDEYSQRVSAVSDEIGRYLAELTPAEADPSSFTCKSPQQFGPVPDQQAVIAYLANARSRDTWSPLVEAARKGNWMARYQVYAALDQRAGSDFVAAYRRLQLMEWLEARRIGTLYFKFLHALAAAGSFNGNSPAPDAPPYVFAALHGSYSAMDSVGRFLSIDNDKTNQAIGKRMRDCAHEMMPVLFPTE